MFGAAFAAVFFGRPEIILLVAAGSMLPDLDREYGFLSKDYFRRLQIHRSVCHSFLFIGLVCLINPFLGLGAFLHTLLDALTTARDRGVEWLFPFTRFVKHAAYDINGNRMKLETKHRIYLLQNDLPILIKNTTKDIKPSSELPWRRTYGPALSGGLLDTGIFFGSLALFAMLLIFSALGIGQYIDFHHNMSPNFLIPLAVGSAGILINFLTGEIDRHKQKKHPDSREKHKKDYNFIFFFSAGLMVLSVALGVIMNPDAASAGLKQLPVLIAGVAIVAITAFATIKIYARRPLPKAGKDPPII